MFVDEFGVRRSVVFADAKYFDFIFLEYLPLVPEIACFFCATRSVIFRVEIDYNSLPTQRRKLHHVAILVRQAEVRCLISDLKCHGIQSSAAADRKVFPDGNDSAHRFSSVV